MVYDDHSSIEKWFMIIMHIEVYDNHSSIEKWFMIIMHIEVYDNPLLNSKCGFMMILYSRSYADRG
jgi:hypothetical protein